jgi:hypothetical protein
LLLPPHSFLFAQQKLQIDEPMAVGCFEIDNAQRYGKSLFESVCTAFKASHLQHMSAATLPYKVLKEYINVARLLLSVKIQDPEYMLFFCFSTYLVNNSKRDGISVHGCFFDLLSGTLMVRGPCRFKGLACIK